MEDEKKKYRHFVFTLNNYTPDAIVRLKQFDDKYVGWAEEVGEKGTPHLQGFIAFTNPRTKAAVNKIWFGNRASFKIKSEKSTFAQARDYYAANPEKPPPVGLVEIGQLPMDQEKKGASNGFAEALALAEDGRAREMDPGMYVRYYRTWQDIEKKAALKRRREDTTVTHEWFYGPTETGKSRTAKEVLGENRYEQIGNKWWDGYDYEEGVLIEDVDTSAAPFARNYKIILDRYPFPVEVKGGMMKIRPKKVIITSNYHPSEIWTDKNSLDPILRRLKITHFCNPISPGLL